MLVVEHRAIHLYREDAYREYCWSVDAYGSWQPASFVYLCFEAFKDACAKFGLRLVHRSEGRHQERFPWKYERESAAETGSRRGLILRIKDDADVAAATEALRRGCNVIALVPSELLGLFYPGDDARVEKAKASITRLGAHPSDWERSLVGHEMRVLWKEIETDTPGRLFVTRDSFLSDGYFMERYGYSEENHEQIRTLIQAFACFKHNLLRLEYRNAVNSWPTGEPLTIPVDVWNHGPELSQVMITLNVSSEFEPLSPLEREIPRLPSLERSSFSVQVVPRVDGDTSLLLGASVSLAEGSSGEVVCEPLRLNITPAIGCSQRSAAPEDDGILSRLVSAFRNAKMPSEVESLPELARVDSRACLNRLRVLAERIVLRVLDSRNIRCRSASLAAAIYAMREHQVVSQRAISYLHTIRVIGNIASHSSAETLSDADVRIVAYALACVVEEVMDSMLR